MIPLTTKMSVAFPGMVGGLPLSYLFCFAYPSVVIREKTTTKTIHSLESLFVLLCFLLFSFGRDFIGIEPSFSPEVSSSLHEQSARVDVAEEYRRVQQITRTDVHVSATVMMKRKVVSIDCETNPQQ